MAIHKAKDNSLKIILADHQLFVEFLRDFVPLEIFRDVTPTDVEDITERFLPLFQENRDSDTVKRINLKGDASLFVIAIAEHESKVNYRASFKMLQYIGLVLEKYEKEVSKEPGGSIFSKDFKYPPVLPIIFFDGPGSWTAETNFLHKTHLHEVFYKYIPKFEYELVNLNKYSQDDLVRFGDALSLLMVIDKIKTADGIRQLGKLPPDYLDTLALKIPPHLNKLIADVITVLLTKINLPKEEVEVISDRIYGKEYQKMFTLIEDYDVQETRRIARNEGIREGELKGKLEGTVNIIKELHLSLSRAMAITHLPESGRGRLIEELKRQHIMFKQ